MHIAALMLYRLAALAQTNPLANSAGAPADGSSGEMTFSDLQKGFREHLSGQPSDTHYRHMLYGVIAVIVLVGILLNLRQRRETNLPPSKPSALFREISKSIRFPFATRFLLQLVARSARVPAATLLISRDLFESSLQSWSHQPTFIPLRNWAATRLNRLHPILFEAQSPSRPNS